jgi:hypothetical protein
MHDLEGRLDAFRKVLVGPEARVPGGAALFATACQTLANSALDYARLAYEHGRADVEPVAEYLAFAERVWPQARGTRKWRAVERRAAMASDRLERGLAWKGRRLAGDLETRLRWRQWRRYGI